MIDKEEAVECVLPHVGLLAGIWKYGKNMCVVE